MIVATYLSSAQEITVSFFSVYYSTMSYLAEISLWNIEEYNILGVLIHVCDIEKWAPNFRENIDD